MAKPVDVINPFDNSVIETVEEADEQDVRAAIEEMTNLKMVVISTGV